MDMIAIVEESWADWKHRYQYGIDYGVTYCFGG